MPPKKQQGGRTTPKKATGADVQALATADPPVERFDTADDYSAQPPVTFVVTGKRVSSGGTFEETFTCLPELPAGYITDLIVATDGSLVLQVRAALAFISGCLGEEDAERFTRLCYDRDTVVPGPTLGRIATRLIERYTGFPTLPSGG